MACGGPSKEYADLQASEAYKDILLLLKTEYNVNIDPKIRVGFPGLDDQQDKNFIDLMNILKDIIWTDHCIGF